MWRAKGLLQDLGHPVEAMPESRTYGVTKCVQCRRRAGRAQPSWSGQLRLINCLRTPLRGPSIGIRTSLDLGAEICQTAQ
jgi:hypothetical protein